MKYRLLAATRACIASVLLAWVMVLPGCSASATAPILASDDIRRPLPRQAALEVQYIANEGVLISSRDKRVLIDGLHREYKRAYAYLPNAEREKIEAAHPPFDNIDLILVSHIHGDHFHPDSVGLYLKHDPKATLATSPQAVEEIAAKFKDYNAVRSRIIAAHAPNRERRKMNISGIAVEFIGISHGTGRHASIQNLGHLITLGGKKLLHLGDAEISVENFADLNLDEESIDIAFLPAWFLTTESGRAIVDDHIKPKHIIGVHIGPGEAEADTLKIKQNFPAADVFTTMLEKRYF